LDFSFSGLKNRRPSSLRGRGLQGPRRADIRAVDSRTTVRCEPLAEKAGGLVQTGNTRWSWPDGVGANSAGMRETDGGGGLENSARRVFSAHRILQANGAMIALVRMPGISAGHACLDWEE